MASLAHRLFVAPASDIADAWFNDPICNLPVSPLGPFSATADGACPVALPDGSVAYVKPRPDADKNLVVAREKIAADLGHLLGFAVAPVAVREPDPTNGWDHHSAMSLACLPAGRTWAEGGAAHMISGSEPLEALRVFWSWIGDSDHNAHGQNLLYEVQGTSCVVLSIDHSHSLCHGNFPDAMAVGMSSGYGTAGLTSVDQTCRDAVQVVMSADWAVVEQLVVRLGGVLTSDEQTRIVQILKERRDRLPGMFGL